MPENRFAQARRLHKIIWDLEGRLDRAYDGIEYAVRRCPAIEEETRKISGYTAEAEQSRREAKRG